MTRRIPEPRRRGTHLLIKVIGFDLDDTLWEVGPIIHRAEFKLNDWLQTEAPGSKYTVATMRELRHELLAAEPELAKQITEFRRRIIELALTRSDIHNATDLSHRAIEVFLAARNEIEFFAGAMDVLSELANTFTLGALSNGNADIKRLGLDNIFSFAYSAEQVGAPKPNPDLFYAALTHTGIDPHQMIYVGDDPSMDIDAAKKLGLKAIWLDHGKKPKGDAEPDHIIHDIRELPTAIAAITNQQ